MTIREAFEHLCTEIARINLALSASALISIREAFEHLCTEVVPSSVTLEKHLSTKTVAAAERRCFKHQAHQVYCYFRVDSKNLG